MPVSFGSGNQYRPEERSSAPAEPLPSNTPLSLSYRFSRKAFREGEDENLRLEIRNTENASQVMWISGGKARSLYPSDDGKTLDGDGGISAASRAGEYFQDFQQMSGLSDEEMSDLSNLEKFQVTLRVKQNPHPKAKKGSMIPVLVSVDPPKATVNEPGPDSGRTAPQATEGNGEAHDVEAVFTPLQLRGLAALQRCVTDVQTLSLADRVDALETIGKYAGTKNQVEQVMVARQAISDPVLRTQDGFTYNAETKEVISVI